MKKSNKDLIEIFSVGFSDSNPEIGEVRKKINKYQRNKITTYKVVAYIAKNKKIKIKDKSLSHAEIDFIKQQFCK